MQLYKLLICSSLCCATILLSHISLAQTATPPPPSNPTPTMFAKGKLNPAFKGMASTFIAKVLEVKMGPGDQLYLKLDMERKGVEPFWASTWSPLQEGTANKGDRLKFIGHVMMTDMLDKSGKLKEFVGGPMMVVIHSLQTLK